MAYVARILSTRAEGNRTRVTFQFEDGEKILGPFVEDRPAEEDHAAWVEARIPQPEMDYLAAFESAIGQENFAALASALADEGVKFVQMGSVFLPVTAQKTNPSDVKALVGARVDAKRGPGTFAGITETFKAMGFPEAQLEFETEGVEL